MSNSTKFDGAKAPLCLIDPVFTEQVARVLAIGEGKYGKNNWRGLHTERLLSAVKRHVLEIEKGNDIDEETGEPHAAHAASGLMFIEWLRRNRPEQDDRRWGTGAAVPVLRADTGGRVHTEQGSEVRLDMPQVHKSAADQPASPRSYTQGTIADSQRAIAAWADRTFPDRTIEEAIKKLKKEAAELEVSGHLDAGEFADVAILLFDIALLQGIDLSRAIENKMRINERRVWAKQGDGTHQHVADCDMANYVGSDTREMAALNTDRAQLQSWGESRAPKTATINAGPSGKITLVQCPQCGAWFGSYPEYTDHYKLEHGAKHEQS